MQSNWQQSKFGASLFGSYLPLRRLLNLAILAVLYPTPLSANPNGAEIIHGQVGIDTSTPGVTNITSSPNAIIHWQNFNIAQNEITRFIQQSDQSAVLNRIIGENPSAILGQLASNGKVFLINPNGIVFGAGATVDTQGFLASTLNLSDQDFLTGNYHFTAGSANGNIVNEGIIRAGKDGNIILIAPAITNNGVIKSEGGQITLAAGQELTITNLDDPAIRFQIRAPENTVINLGKLLTEGGAVNVFANSISHSGEINANSVSVDAKGNINLIAEQDVKLSANSKLSANNSQGDAGNIHVESKTGTTLVEGIITAKASQNGHGGKVAILGERVGVLGQAQIDVSGEHGGGEILAGGDTQGKNTAIHNAKATFVAATTQLKADAENVGNGGKVIVWADQATRAYGEISAKGGRQSGDGGFVETSGYWLDTSAIKVDASAAHGKGGQWLLDPNDITIQAKGTDTNVTGGPDWTTKSDSAIITTHSIETALNNGTSVSITTGTAPPNSQQGNITVASAITKSAGGDAGLSLNAHNNITINAPISSTAGKLNLLLRPDWDGQNGGVTNINKYLDLNTGTLTLYGTTSMSALTAIKNASLIIPTLSNTELNGILTNVDSIDIADNADLTINHGNADFNGLINNRGTLTINAYFALNQLNLDGGLLTGSGQVTVLDEFEFESGTVAGSGTLVTAAGSVTDLATSGTAYLEKNWTNFGTVNWQSIGDLAQKTAANVTFNNQQGGIINIGEAIGALNGSVRHLNMAVFNNRGTVDLTGGTLGITGSGSDSGSYLVSGNGLLQFLQNTRAFNGATIDSVNPVSFVNGDYRFVNGAVYTVPETIINNAAVTFSTGANITLPGLTLNQGTLTGADAVEVSDYFNFHSGTLAGSNTFTTAGGSLTTLADVGTVFLNKYWTNFGTVNWQGEAAIGASTGNFTNGSGGVFNISGAGINDPLNININRFNNDGIINVSNATLKLYSSGSHTGSYGIADTGRLQLLDGTRKYNGAVINSANTVRFVGGKDRFNSGSIFNAPQILIDNATVTFNTGSAIHFDALTIDNNGLLNSSDNIDVLNGFKFYSGIFTGSGNFLTRSESSNILTDGNALINKNWDNYGIVNFSAATATSNLSSLSQTTFPVRQWNNFGTLNWFGDTVPANALGSIVILNNKESGVFKITNSNPADFRELSLGAFNNQGTVKLLSGGLKIMSNGSDTGSYIVTGSGQLQFVSSTRSFNNGSRITSSNAVAFVDGINNFNQGAVYNAPNTLIDGATVNFNTDITLDGLVMSGGILYSNHLLSVDNAFNWSGGTLTGSGQFNFNNGFNYSAGVMAATGSVYINDHSDNLLLPAMPSVTRLLAQTTGNLQLSGDINASGNGTAIQLITDHSFNNAVNANLTADNGRWLVYSDNPATNSLGGLAAIFKHYGCSFSSGCNDTFAVTSATGNGVLYRLIPILTVTPDAITSIYGDNFNFSAGYSGFIDGDTSATAAITGAASYRVGGALSSSGHYNAGIHDVSYLGGLANKLGYQFQNNLASVNELTVTPRALTVVANPAAKSFGSPDPLFTYNLTGLVAGDSLAGTLSRTGGEDLGNYDIIQGSINAGSNYTLNYTGANFKINPAAPVIDDDTVQEQVGNQQNSELVLSQQLVLGEQLDNLTNNKKKIEAEQSPELQRVPEKNQHRVPKQCK